MSCPPSLDLSIELPAESVRLATLAPAQRARRMLRSPQDRGLEYPGLVLGDHRGTMAVQGDTRPQWSTAGQSLGSSLSLAAATVTPPPP